MTACGISIHAAREGGDATDIYNGYKRTKISIHAAREGGDRRAAVLHLIQIISIHAAREGGDCAKSQPRCKTVSFQSTPPVKAATGGLLYFT